MRNYIKDLIRSAKKYGCLHLYSATGLTKKDMLEVFKQIPLHTFIEKIKIRKSLMTEEGMLSDLFKNVSKNPNIQSIEIDTSCLEEEHVIIIADFIVRNKFLVHLSLEGNLIRNKGAAILAEALKKNITLESLDLSYNCIGDEGYNILVETAKKSHIKFIDFTHNRESLLNKRITYGSKELVVKNQKDSKKSFEKTYIIDNLLNKSITYEDKELENQKGKEGFKKIQENNKEILDKRNSETGLKKDSGALIKVQKQQEVQIKNEKMAQLKGEIKGEIKMMRHYFKNKQKFAEDERMSKIFESMQPTYKHITENQQIQLAGGKLNLDNSDYDSDIAEGFMG